MSLATRLSALSTRIGRELKILRVEYRNYVQSRGTDLVTNGTGFLGSNTNFSWATFDATDAPVGAAGSFVSSGSAGTYLLDEFLPVDPSKKMQFSYWIRQTGASDEARFYAAFAPYDAFYKSISPTFYMYEPGTLTTLAQELKPGDTKIYLMSAGNWLGSTSRPAGSAAHRRSLIFWDYTDPGGKLWPAETYSRNFYGGDKWADGGIVGAHIDLRAPYDGPAKPQGTKLSNGSSGGTYMYPPGQGNVQLTQHAWERFSASIRGLAPDGAAASFLDGWPQGVAFVKAGWLLNRSASGTTEPNSKMAVAAVSFSDASAAQATADMALAGLAGKADAIPGTMIIWPSHVFPAGYLLCNGSAFSSVTYPALAGVLKDTFGTHSGTTYYLPDPQGRALIGVGQATGAAGATTHTLGQKDGEETHALSEAEMPAHTHVYGVSLQRTDAGGGGATRRTGNPNDLSGVTQSTGDDVAHNTMPPYLGIYYLIKT